VVADDLNRLEVQEFLNDTVIDFYIKWVEGGGEVFFGGGGEGGGGG